MSTARRHLKSGGPYSVHPPIPSCSPKSQHHGHAWTTHIPLVYVNRPSHSLDKAFSNFDLDTSRSRSWMGSRARRPSTLVIPSFFISHQSAHQFPRFSYIEIGHRKTLGQDHNQGKRSDHMVYPVPNRWTCLPFNMNWTNHSWHMTKKMFDLAKTHPQH